MARIFFTPHANRDFKHLPPEIKDRIRELLDGDFAENPFAPQFGTKKLQPPLYGYRVRVGRYRILFNMEAELIRVYKIKHRRDAYK